MKLRRTITTEESESTIRDRVATHLGKMGYRQVSLRPLLVYERGSVYGSLMSFLPKDWKVKATIQINSTPEQKTNVSIDLSINAIGQWVTKKERAFWNSELEGLETAIQGSDVDAPVAASESQQAKPVIRVQETSSPKSAGRWAKVLVLIWGIVVLLPVVPLVPVSCCVVLSAIGYSGPEMHAYSLGLATLVVIGVACGGTMLFGSSRALAGRPSEQLRLPPLWAAIGAFVIALTIGLGLWQLEGVAPLLGPWFIIAAAALPPLAAVVWAVNGRPGWLTWRRAGVAFSGGVTVSVPLAILLEILVPTIVIGLLLDLGEPVLNALGELVDLLAGGRVARALTSSGFLIALVELALVAPLVEELTKSLVVLPLLRGLKSRRDAFLLGVAAGAGFAALENIIYALFSGRYWGGILTVRALGAAVHPLGTGLTAVAWHALLNRNPGTDRRWVGGFGLAVAQHAVWNGGLALWMALSGAAFFGPKPWEANVMGVGIAVGMLAIIALEGVALWIGLRVLSRRLNLAVIVEAFIAEEIPTERAIALWAVACLVVLLPVGLVVLQAVWGK